MAYKNAIILAGPSTTGKTKLAIELAKKEKGSIIHADKFYQFDYFLTSIGLPKHFKEIDIPFHLYGILNPKENRLNVPEYVEKVEDTIPEILEEGRLPIIEGCSYGYINGLIEKGRESKRKFHYKPAIAIQLPKEISIEEKVEERIDSIFKYEIINEIKIALKKGYKNTYVMRKSVICASLVNYLEGKSNMNETKIEMINGFLRIIYDELRKFKTIPELKWVEHHPSRSNETLEQIMDILKNER